MNSNWIVYKLQAYFGRISNICKLNVWDSNSYISNIWKLNDKLTAGILSVHDFKQCYVLFVIYAIHQWCLPCSDEAIWSDLSLWGNHDLSLLSLNHARRFKTIPENQLIGQSWSRMRFIWKPSTHSSFTFLIPHSLFCPWALSAFSPFFSTDCHCHCWCCCCYCCCCCCYCLCCCCCCCLSSIHLFSTFFTTSSFWPVATWLGLANGVHSAIHPSSDLSIQTINELYQYHLRYNIHPQVCQSIQTAIYSSCKS